MGFSDARLGEALEMKNGRAAAEKVYQLRKEHNVRPVFKRVDTCAAEFESYTPYLYSTYEEEDEAPPTDRKKVIILGSGPESHRAGHRVRLLLLPRGVRAARRRLRDDHDQLQS